MDFSRDSYIFFLQFLQDSFRYLSGLLQNTQKERLRFFQELLPDFFLFFRGSCRYSFSDFSRTFLRDSFIICFRDFFWNGRDSFRNSSKISSQIYLRIHSFFIEKRGGRIPLEICHGILSDISPDIHLVNSFEIYFEISSWSPEISSGNPSEFLLVVSPEILLGFHH